MELSHLVEPSFKPDFSKGLVPVIAQDASTLEVLMLAWINAEAWKLSLETGEAHYFSRSRQKIWHKGETSGHVQKLVAIRLDCDADAVLFLVKQAGNAACHTGHASCFFRELNESGTRECSPVIFDPSQVYSSS